MNLKFVVILCLYFTFSFSYVCNDLPVEDYNCVEENGKIISL